MSATKPRDPLVKFREGVRAGVGGVRKPIPLASTAIAVRIAGGLAVVTTVRTFRNAEKQDIEPTMTFPVPVDASLCSLSAEIDGRVLNAEAQAKQAARETYEDAIDAGKSAVLHEELLKGVHMLSVGRVRAGGEVKVTSVWVAPLTFAGASPKLRIPVTVGDIYGVSPLLASDGFAVGGHVHEAEVRIVCDYGMATLLGAGAAVDGVHKVALDAPIEIAVAGWKPVRLEGVSADGRQVLVTVEPSAKSERALEVDVLNDRSTSTNDRAEGGTEFRKTKFQVAMEGLLGYAKGSVGPADVVRAWEFSNDVSFLGSARGSSAVAALFGRFRTPSGGTELGRAFAEVCSREETRDVVVVTDGKSWSFDPSLYAKSGIRVTAVLVGEDALEGGVADLAGMSGGQVFVALGTDTDAAVAAAMEASRTPYERAEAIVGRPEKLSVHRRGAVVSAVWGKKIKGVPTPEARQIGAFAASLAVPLMEKAEAAAFAASEGIVCHLTSLVLVDEAGEKSDQLPASRKVELSRPRTAMTYGASGGSALRSMSLVASGASFSAGGGGGRSRSAGWSVDSGRGAKGIFHTGNTGALGGEQWSTDDGLGDDGFGDLGGLSGIAFGLGPVSMAEAVAGMDWTTDPEGLRKGDLSSQTPHVAQAIRMAAAMPDVVEAAKKAGLDPVAFVVALMARARAGSDRSASRMAKAMLRSSVAGDLDGVARGLGL